MKFLGTLSEYVAAGLIALGLIASPVQAPTLPTPPPEYTQQPEGEEFVYDTPENDAPEIEVYPDAQFGAALPQQDALIDTYLASNITNTQTTMTLADGTLRDGTTLSGYYCFTLDINTPTLEYVCGTASSTSVTGLLRGVKVSNPNATSSSLAYSHRRFATVQVTDFPFNQLVQRILNGTDPLSAPLYYDNGIGPVNGADLADKEYVLSAITGTSTLSYNRIIVSGTAGETVSTGTVVYLKPAGGKWFKADSDDLSTYQDRELGVTQGAATTDTTIPGGVLTYGIDSTQVGMAPAGFLQRYLWLSSTAGGTSTATTTQILGEPISDSTFFFDPQILDTQIYIPTTFNQTTSFAATNTFSGTTTVYGFNPTTIVNGIYVASTTGTSTFSVPAGIKKIKVQLVGGGGNGGNGDNGAQSGGGGGSGGYSMEYIDVSATSTIIYYVGAATEETRFGGGPSAFLRATGGTTGTAGASTAAGGIGGLGSGGDINIQGGGGSGGGLSGAGEEGDGAGGSSMLGGGAQSTGGGGDVAGAAGGNYGGGGSGGHGSGSGGAGSVGAIIIEW